MISRLLMPVGRVAERTAFSRNAFGWWYRSARNRTDEGVVYRALQRTFSSERGWVVYDIGANDAGSAIAYARAFPACRVELFEAHPEVARIAQGRLGEAGLERRTRLHTYAASDADGTATFHVSSEPNRSDWRNRVSDSSSLLAPAEHLNVFASVAFESAIEVPTRRLDGAIDAGELPAPDFIHMDVQGAELMVLNGLGVHVAGVKLIWLEVERVELFEGQPLAEEVATYLAGRGFTLEYDGVAGHSGNQLWSRA